MKEMEKQNDEPETLVLGESSCGLFTFVSMMLGFRRLRSVVYEKRNFEHHHL